MTLYSALLDSSLGQIVLQATSQGLSGLYFAGQKDCPALPGLPMAQGEALDPRAGRQAGRPIHSMRLAQSEQTGSVALLPDTAPVEWVGSTLSFPGAPPEADALAIFKQTQVQLASYFKSQQKVFSVTLDLRQGTDFQRAVWKTLLEIPYGDCWSYGQVARAAGYGPGYGRATGAAVGANPITIIVPCHRVVASNQRLNGYSGGLHRKLALLQHEGLALAA